MSILIISEKPSVGRAISSVIGAKTTKKGYIEGNNYIVSWCVGHLVGLKYPNDYGNGWQDKWSFSQLPMIPDKWLFKVTESTKEQYDILKNLMSRNDVTEIICATDADREGETIFRYVYNMLGCHKSVKRLWVSSLEESAIRKALSIMKPMSDYDNLFAAGFSRAKADWLVGMNGSRLFSCRYKDKLNLGRVQTPTLAMIVQRDHEVKNFIRQKYFTCDLDCGDFRLSSARIDDEGIADSLVSSCNDSSVTVMSVKKEIKTVNPPKLYDLTTLQREANKAYGYTAQQTLDCVQSLYEGKLVTYPRTDSQFLSDDMEQTALDIVRIIGEKFSFGTVENSNISRCISNSKVTGHHAIIPTANISTVDLNSLPMTERNILELIANRLLCASALPHKYESVKISAKCGDTEFTANGKTVLEKGWKQYALRTSDDEESKALPQIAEGQQFSVTASKSEHFTSPPKPLPACIAFVEALSDSEYLNSLKSGKFTPMMYVNGPVARQIGIDNTQGMTTEETNIAIGRFMELALINLAGIKRTNAFGNVQPLVFSENDETCLNIGWKPHHVEKGYQLNDNVITATSFSMWGNNVTPATDLPEEIMKVLAWDITEKNLGALGSASVEDNANTHRLIFITESVASALATKYKSKDSLESALVENARRPLWMRAYAYYYANTGGALTKSFDEVYNELKCISTEDVKSTASPSWMNGITYSNIDTVATMIGNTDIIVTGDSSRNKTQVMPGGISITKKVKLSDNWDKLVTSVNYNPIDSFYLSEQDNTITPPANVPSVLTDGTYRILDPVSGSSNLTRPGRVYYDSASNTLYCYAQGASGTTSIVLDSNKYSSFIAYLTNLGYNSSFTVNNGKFTDMTIRFSSNESKLRNNTIALTDKSFAGLNLTLHANNTSGSDAAGGLAKNGATVELSSTITSYTVSLDDDIVMGDTTNAKFVKLNGTKITVDPSVEAGAAAIIGAENSNGTFRTMTFVNGGDGTYTITYNTANTSSNADSTFYLKGSFNNQDETDVFKKTDNSDVITLTKELSAGKYTFKLYNLATDKWYGKNDTVITDTTNRLVLVNAGNECVLNATGGIYEFKYEISTNRLSIYFANDAVACIGDCNDDGTFNIADVVLLQKWLLAVPNVKLPNWKAADLYEDGRLDVFDLCMMKRLLLNS